MFKTTKLVSVFALSGALLAAVITPAHALSIIAPIDQGSAQSTSEPHRPLAAFTAGAADASALNNSLLSPDSVRHIQWCAKRYSSYHPTDNTYALRDGVRAECRSPNS